MMWGFWNGFFFPIMPIFFMICFGIFIWMVFLRNHCGHYPKFDGGTMVNEKDQKSVTKEQIIEEEIRMLKREMEELKKAIHRE